jgi:hypothetical protein
MTALWNKVVELDKVSIAIADGTKEAQLYGNGKHQIPIIVSISPVGMDGGQRKELTVDPDNFQSYVKLIDSETGKALPLKSSPDGAEWVWSGTPNNFPGNRPAYRDNQAIFYVMTGQYDISKSIAVEVTLTDGAVYSTGKDSKNGLQDSVLLHAKMAVDYSKPELWEVVDGTFHEVGKVLVDSGLISGDSLSGTSHDSNGALSRWKKVSIRRRRDSAPGELLTTTLGARSVDGATVEKLDSHTVSGFPIPSTSNYTLHFRGKPSAVVGFGGDNADALFWFVEPREEFGVMSNSKVGFVSPRHWYRVVIGSDDQRHVQKPDALDNNAISVYLWNLRITDDNIKPSGWGTQYNDAYVHVIDSFGNEGKLKISFSQNWVPHLI